MIQVAKKDIVTPFHIATKAAARIPNGEILSYDCQHFEPYLDPYFHTVVTDQINFLHRYVRPGH